MFSGFAYKRVHSRRLETFSSPSIAYIPTSIAKESMSKYETLKAKYDAASQGHLFHFWSQLGTPEREALLAQLAALDIDRVNRVFSKAIQAESTPSADDDKIEFADHGVLPPEGELSARPVAGL